MRMPTLKDLRRLAAAAGTAFAAAAACLAIFAAAAPAEQRGPVVFAAASIKNALDDANAAWTKEGRGAAVISYAASSALARQIDSGAPADLFISADLDWMDYLAKRNRIAAGKRVNLLANSIVLIAPAARTVAVTMRPKLDLAPALGNGRLAMAHTEAVPAGKYGKAALQALGAWEGVKDRIAQAENVRAALLLVSRGEAPIGIVYRTDATVDPKVKILATFPAGSHPPIVYPAAVTADARHADAGAFFDFLRSPAAKAAFERYGFTVLD